MNNQAGRESLEDLKSKSLKKAVFLRFIAAFISLSLLFFLPAWTFNYWQAWVYMFVMLALVAIMVGYLYRHDPALLERRMRTQERQKSQKLISALFTLFFLPALIIPGLDVRYGWSQVPLIVIVMADIAVLLGYLAFALVLKTNSYASRVVDVEKGQKVITTGPYAVVRHPMYSSALIIFTFSPLALGSYWAMIPAAIMVLILMARISGEEKELRENLEGYREYMQKTKYRLVPGIW